MPAELRIFRTVEGAIRCLSGASSPWIRRWPPERVVVGDLTAQFGTHSCRLLLRDRDKKYPLGVRRLFQA